MCRAFGVHFFWPTLYLSILFRDIFLILVCVLDVHFPSTSVARLFFYYFAISASVTVE